MNPAEYYAATLPLYGSSDPLNAELGIIGEIGEITELFKKHWFHKKDWDPDALLLELGDLLFYAFMHSHLEIDWSVRTEWPEPPKRVYPSLMALKAIHNTALPTLRTRDVEYLITVIGYFGFPLETIAKANVEKLQKRWPNGFLKPSTEA